MIKLNINNNRKIQISQEQEDRKINVDVLGDDDTVDYSYTITAAEMVQLLNQYQYDNNIV